MKKNILVTGCGQTNFLFQLYGNIAPKLQQFDFNSINLRKFGDSDIENRAKEIFKENYQYKFKFHNIFQILGALLTIINTKYFWKDQRISFAEIGWKHIKQGYYLTNKHISAYHYAKFIDKETKTDIIHLHYPSHGNNLFLIYLTEDYKLIQTFWGSDIYRIKSWMVHEIQKETLNNSDIITTGTPEMRFALLNRYGPGLSEKIRNVKLIHNDTYYQLVDRFSVNLEWQGEFKKSWGIPENKIIVLFGHNAHRENNHLKFIEVLEKLPAEIVSSLHIIFPLTYGNPKKDHINIIKEKTAKIATSFTFVEEFMDWEALAKLKLISQVYIHAPTTDALSSYLTEYFYANNLAIVGGWLPYKTFTNMGLKYLEFEDFGMLKDVLMDLPNHISTFKNHNRINRNIVAENFSVDKISNKWVGIFKEFEN